MRIAINMLLAPAAGKEEAVKNEQLIFHSFLL